MAASWPAWLWNGSPSRMVLCFHAPLYILHRGCFKTCLSPEMSEINKGQGLGQLSEAIDAISQERIFPVLNIYFLEKKIASMVRTIIVVVAVVFW